VLETHTIRRVGGKKDIEVDVRIIAATNKKLENELFRIKKQMTKILNEKTSFSNSYMDIKRSENMGHVAQI
jgi:transcriptional regulator with GAF, ATPase, and Fis domain